MSQVEKWNPQAATVETRFRGLWRGLLRAAVWPDVGEIIAGRIPTGLTESGPYWSGDFGDIDTPINIGTLACEIRLDANPGTDVEVSVGYFIATGDQELVTFRYVNSGTDIVAIYRHDTGGNTIVDANISFPYYNHWAIRWNDGPDLADTFKNGQPATQNITRLGSSLDGSSQWSFSTLSGGGKLLGSYYYLWDRELTDAEIRLVYSDPFGLVRRQRMIPMFPATERPLPRIIVRSP